ncbi:MAG TPA: XdhC family protein [Sandaracinaceae bacterium LLY-WYZ-13_1]|nr:XdhC family protein [Sandaracinaceae bacterium LLY-WYZ-13_1]
MSRPPTETHDALDAAAGWLEAGEPVALATVLETWGSSPCPPGSRLAVNGRGRFAGSVSGGCVEAAVVRAAGEVLRGGAARSLRFGVADADAWDVGLPCGGEVSVLVTRETRDGIDARRRARRAERRAVWCARLDTGAGWLVGDEPMPADRAGARRRPGSPRAGAGRGSTPAPPDERAPPSRRSDEGAPASRDAAREGAGGPGLAPADVPRAVWDAARRTVGSEAPRVVDAEGRVREGELAGGWLLDPVRPRPRLLIVGAVHVAQALSSMAITAGFAVTVIDPRARFLSEARFGAVARRVGAPGEVLASLAPGRATAVVVLSHDAKIDDPALRVALASDALYVGALGSRRTQAARRERLARAGVSADRLARIHGPIGLDLGARTPAQIAVAILAEVVDALNRARTGSGS